FIPFVWFSLGAKFSHPIFVSVTEIEHNAKDKTLEVSCKIFTDDFEKALRTAYKTPIDLQDNKIKPAMNKLVNDYVQKHLKINADGRVVVLKYLGFEKIEEGIYSYFEAENINTVKKITISNNILFEYSKQQISLVHVMVGGNRQSTKLNNPESSAFFEF
ncbi:MAG: hypothetical protein LH615_04370, partial [Ferruginibacter sp.]|nr:hypothetical protein [Ferruginibacter sp.]